jgi:ATP-dependent helicase/nuclease subunit A
MTRHLASDAEQSRDPELTDQQRRAVETRDVSVVLSSGAGCGKTHVLTERYLSHLRIDGAEVGQIVAITFTDRAARQMRGRIRAALTKHLRDATSEEEAESRARHLRGLETAPISTIHSFCGTLLRQNAFDAGLDPQFEVFEEVLAINVRADAAEACLQKLLTAHTEVAEDLRQLILRYGWRSAVEAIENLLRYWDGVSWQRWLDRDAADVAQQWQSLAQGRLLPGYIAYLLATKPFVVNLTTLLERYPPLPGPMADSVRILLDGLPRLASAADSRSLASELAEAAKVGHIGKKAWPDPDVYGQIKDAMEAFRKGIRDLKLEWFATSEGDAREAVEVGRRFVRVASAVQHAYQERKQALAFVDFQDLLIRARDLLRDRPDVRARLQDRYRFVLIDELQDTDPVQMEFVEYLCGGGMTAGKLFAVGDSKQSIYRFRGAEVQLFQNLRERVPHVGRQRLTVNFRSQPEILRFVNALFARRLVDFEPLEAFDKQVNPGPCIEFLWSPREEKSSVTEARVAEAAWIARRIAAMVTPGAESLVVDREGSRERLRPTRPGDVVLLFRSMSNVHLYEAALREYGLNYYLVGGRAFFAQQEIYDILNLLRTLENPQDSVGLAGTLRSPFCCVSDEALFVLAGHAGGLWDGLHDDSLQTRLPVDQRERVARAARFLIRWRELKDRMPIASLLNAIFAESGFDAAMRLESLGDRKLANLWKLLDLARIFDRSGLFGLAEFIARLGDLVRSQPREEQAATQPENADVVRLMSIHQAKGLEFPVVIIPDLAATVVERSGPHATWDAEFGCVARPPHELEGPPFTEFGWRLLQAHRELEDWHEELRTLYVGCTRARDYLILSTAMTDDVAGASTWMSTLSERFEVASGRCIAADVPDDRKPQIRVFDRLRPPPDAKPIQPNDQEPLQIPGLASWFESTPVAKSGDDALADDVDGEPLGAVRKLSVDLVVRSVLSMWDYRDRDSWQSHLKVRGSRLPAGQAEEAAQTLSRFAQSDLRERLAGAEELHTDMAFVFDPPREQGCDDARVIRGMIDCLWKEGQRWHLLGFYDQAASLDSVWDNLVFSAAAMSDQIGAPASLTVFDLRTMEPARKTAGRFSLARLLTESLARLSGRNSTQSSK